MRSVSREKSTHPVLTFWIIAGWVGYCLLPWYGVEKFWSLEWLLDGWPVDDDYAPAALLLVVLGFALALPDGFARPANLVNITQQMALLSVVALGATVVMALGEFDLSVSAVASWAGVAGVLLMQAGWPPAPAMAAVLLSCAAVGAVSGALVAGFRVPSFVATLAVGTILGGITFWASGGATLFGALPEGFRALARGGPLGVPALTLWMLGAAAVAWAVLDRLEIGRRVRAIGGNRRAALLAGVPVRRDTVWAFALCTALAGLAGLLLAARLGSAHPTGGGGFLLQAYAAVFRGMTAFRDGEANVTGTLVGAALIAVLANGLTIGGVPAYLQDVLTGAIILAAVLLRRPAAGEEAG